MRSLNKFTLNVRRETFLKGIQKQEREMYKEQRRAKLIKHTYQIQQLRQFKMNLLTIDPLIDEQRVIRFLEFVQLHAIEDDFCQMMVESYVMQEIMQLVGAFMSRKHMMNLEISLLVQKLFETLYLLLARSSLFLEVIKRHFRLLVYLLYLYPDLASNMDKLSKFITYITDPQFNQTWREYYLKSRMVAEEEVIGRLLALYIQQENYVIKKENTQSHVTKLSQKWFKNAIKCLEVVNGLIQIQTDREAIWKADLITQSLYQGLSIFIRQKQFFIQCYDDSDSTDSDSMGEGPSEHALQSKQTNIYLISVILDILLLKESVLDQRQGEILKSILQVLLKVLDRYQIINMTAIKVIKILYEQVILDEEELEALGNQFQCLRPLIESIIQNDIF